MCIVLAILFTGLINLLISELSGAIDTSSFSTRPLSERTEEILKDASGQLQIWCIIKQDHPGFNEVGHLLRALKERSQAVAGPQINLHYIDPRRNYRHAAELAALHVRGFGLLFQYNHRSVFLPLSDLYQAPTASLHSVINNTTEVYQRGLFNGEAICASTIARLSRKDGAPIYWLTGHGETDFTNVDQETGYTALQRELRHEGFTLRPLNLIKNLTSTPSSIPSSLQEDRTTQAPLPQTPLKDNLAIPEDCEAIILMAPRYPLNREERIVLSEYINRGGRLLLVLPPTGSAGLEIFLEQWGIQVGTKQLIAHDLLTGTISIATPIGDHPITHHFAKDTSFYVGAPRELFIHQPTGTPIHITRLLGLKTQTRSATIAIAAERGSNTAVDIALRPGRIIVLSEGTSSSNSLIGNRTSANRDFMVNAIQWLTDISPGLPTNTQLLQLQLTERRWQMLLLVAVFACPLGAGIILSYLFKRKRYSA